MNTQIETHAKEIAHLKELTDTQIASLKAKGEKDLAIAKEKGEKDLAIVREAAKKDLALRTEELSTKFNSKLLDLSFHGDFERYRKSLSETEAKDFR